MSLVDLTGKKFSRWTVESLCGDSGKVKFWNCICECGTRKRVFGGDLKRGGSRSCGCFTRETSANRLRSHGMSSHPAYRSWIEARLRCEYPEKKGFKDYGGRGITVCARWLTFDAFWEDMGPTWAIGLTLDRKDTNGPYEPANCRWATPRQQANNRRDNRLIDTPKGRMNVTQAAEAFSISRITLFSRLRANWPIDHLFDPPRFTTRDYYAKKG